MAQRTARVHFVYQWITSGIICALSLIVCSKSGFAQKQGHALIDSLLQKLSERKEDSNKVRMLNKLGNLYSSIEPDEGLKYGNEALMLSQEIKWKKGIADAYNIIGQCYEYKSDYSTTIAYWNKALKIFEEQRDKKGMLKIIGNYGVVYTEQGDYSSALEKNLIALKYAEDLGDSVSVSINLGNIGSDYDYLANFSKALEYGLRALRISEQLRDTQSIALYMGNIGNVYIDQKNYPEALKYQMIALKYDEYLGNNEGIERDTYNIGSIYISTKHYDTALLYFDKTLELSKKIGFKSAECKVLNSLGDAFIRIAKDTVRNYSSTYFSSEHAVKYNIPANKAALVRTSIDYLKKSIAIALEINDLDVLQSNYYALSEARKMQGDYKGSLESNNKYIAIKDSVFSMESKIKIANLETKREVQLKDKQLEIDRLEVEKKHNIQAGLIAGMVLLVIVSVIGFRNQRLAAAKELSENKLYAFQARMNPHFIFNSLNTIQSLILNNETIPSIRYLSEFSKLMRQILDNSAKSKVRLKDEIQMLRSYITLEQLRYNNFKWEINIAENISEDFIYIPGMIIQPFVENSIIHGFQPENKDGMLNISFEGTEKQIVCTVDDNGIGRQKSVEINRERSRNRQSHGINIATSRLALLNNKKKGLVNKVIYEDKMENGIAAGTKVIIQIPIL